MNMGMSGRFVVNRTWMASLVIAGTLFSMGGTARPAIGQTSDTFSYADRSINTLLRGHYSSIPADAAAVDYDHDGMKDLILGTTETVCKQSGVTAENVPKFLVQAEVFPGLPTDPEGFIIADYNNDSWIDLYVPSLSTGGHRLYKNNSGVFEDVTASVGAVFSTNKHSIGGAWGDYDGDGDVDLLLLLGGTSSAYPRGSDSQKLLRNDTIAGVTTFSAEQYMVFQQKTRIRQAFWADFNKDHDLDLVLMQGCNDATACGGVNGSPNNSTLYVNVDNSEFVDGGPWGLFPGGPLLKGNSSMATIADVNNDGNLDLLYSAIGKAGYLVTEPWTDGIPNWNDGEVKLKSGWTRSSTDIGENPFDIINLDYNLDGRRDFLGVSPYAAFLYKNYDNGSSEYAFPIPTNAITAPFGAAFNKGGLAANFVNDGFTDLYFARQSSTVFFCKTFDSDPSTLPQWVGIRLQSTWGSNNYCGIGATVTVTAGNHVEAQIVDGGSGKGVQNDLDLIFGLGDYSANTVDVEIRWPAGQTNQYTGVATRQFHTLGDAPNVIDASVSSGLIYHAATGQTDWVFTWTTGPNYDVTKDKIIFNTYRLPASCIPAYSSLTLSVPNVTVNVVQNAVGTYDHTLTWLDAGCVAVCNIPFTAESGHETYVSTSARKYFTVEACLSGGN